MKAMNGIEFVDSLPFGDSRIGDQFPTKAEADFMNMRMGKWLEARGIQTEPMRVIVANSMRAARRRKSAV